jgi:hypothetical protein
MNPVRITALVLLAAGAVMFVLDIMERLLSTSWNGMALGYLWGVVSPGSLRGAESFVETHLSVGTWQQVLLPLLMLPAWVALLVLGIITFIFGKRFDE